MEQLLKLVQLDGGPYERTNFDLARFYMTVLQFVLLLWREPRLVANFVAILLTKRVLLLFFRV